MRILVAILALLIACSPIDTNVPPSSLLPDLSVVDMAGLPPQDLVVVTGPTRIVQRTWAGSDGVVVKTADLYDTVEKIPCALQRASDGVARCMPTAGVIFYQDSTCSIPVAHIVVGCAPDKYYRVSTTNQCGVMSPATPYRVGMKLTLSKLYLGSACLDVSSQISTFDFYSLVAVSPSTFAAGTFNY